ncbi:MAG TPA: RecX family transcriptional regulator [Phototrophicaceae bacterium]|nr:RecX family transcriptional regulator [Phototrophicaceae bacterium]
MGIVTALEVQKRNKKRVSVYVDDAYAFSLSLDEAARLHKGQVLSDAEIETLVNDAAITAATDSAARFLGLRPRSAKEVRDNLAKKGLSPAVIDAALERLTAFGYIDDRAFANLWVQDRMTYKPTSPRALRYELRQKGISSDVIDAALADLDAEEAAYQAAEAQSRRLHNLSQREFQTKLGALLQRRGFSYSVARTAIRRLIQELEDENPDYFAGTDVDMDGTETDILE